MYVFVSYLIHLTKVLKIIISKDTDLMLKFGHVLRSIICIIHFRISCYVFFSNSNCALVSLPFINGVTRLQTSSCHKKDIKILRIIIFILVYGGICNKIPKNGELTLKPRYLIHILSTSDASLSHE